MNLYVGSICILLMFSTAKADDSQSYHQCFEKDSISCIQLAIFRQAKSFFDKPKIDLFAGLSIVKSNNQNNNNYNEIVGARSAKSIEDNSIAVETAKSVEDRNSQMESYLMTNVKNFFEERSLNFNFANAARSVSNAIPDQIKSDIRDLVFEGRTKKKLLLKKLLPLILGLKVKILLLIIGAIAIIGLIAKKALVISIVALALAAFGGLGTLLGRGGGGGGGGGGGLLSGLGSLFGSGSNTPPPAWSSGGAGGWNGGGGGWGAGGGGWGGGSGWDSHGSYSSPVAQTLAYSGHKTTR